MLQLQELRKQYRTADLVQNALDGVSINFRNKEFVAILGPSGSGKTTLLNVIGGLDRYDSGDMLINGVSTKKYKDRDWDTYRNHTIGFVFQSYNLIQHQSVLANVELALTISGVSVMERKKRAKEALEKVGLGAQINKKPNQLSGGQMQRVAIARALVNDPDILLADEPTGALDSETSVQVMDLLKEVAKDRLVIMVTHNPELANDYATRIVRIKDGKVTDDSDPFDPETEVIPVPEKTAPHKGKRASMSFLTALSLSFNNLRTKKARTILVAVAGSIGLIGIALIQSLSNGVNDYIDDIEETTVLSYPVSMYKTGISMSTYMSMFSEMEDASGGSDSDTITVNQLLHKYASGLTSNDLKSLNTYLLEETDITDYTKAIEYTYDVTPQIYRTDGDEIRRINPDQSIDNMGMTFASVSSMNLAGFYQLPENECLYEEQYDVKAGHWPTNSSECVLVLGDDGSVTDVVLYLTGLKDVSEMEEVENKLLKGENVTLEENPETYSYDDFIGLTFKVINSCNNYVYDDENGFWVDKTSDKTYLKKIYDEGRDLTICGVVCKKDGVDGSLSTGICYTADLVTDLIKEAAESDVVKAQMADSTKDVLTGKDFGEETDINDLDLASLISIDTDAIQNAFSFNTDALSGIDFSSAMGDSIDLSGLDLSNILDADDLKLDLNISDDDVKDLLQSLTFDASNDEVQEFITELVSGYLHSDYAKGLISAGDIAELLAEYIQSDEAAEIIKDFVQDILKNALENMLIDPNELLEKFKDANPDDLGSLSLSDIIDMDALSDLTEISSEQLSELAQKLSDGFKTYIGDAVTPDASTLLQGFSDYLAQDEVQEKINSFVSSNLDLDNASSLMEKIAGGISDDLKDQLSEVIQTAVTNLSSEIASEIGSQISSGLESAMSQLSDGMGDILSIDSKALKDAFKFNMSEDSIKDLMTTLSNGGSDSYEDNLLTMGYASLEDPESILIYSKDFSSKGVVLNILSDYNEKMKEAGDEDKVVAYSDIAGTMMSSVSDIVGVVSTVLIALVAISLVVSSIMIGVITYISVLERKKEIGILRALGASKGNVSNVFNAETFITGLFAGLLGISVSFVLVQIANYVIHNILNQQSITAFLDPASAVLLVILSIILNIIAGFLPSRKAANSNPVTALRED